MRNIWLLACMEDAGAFTKNSFIFFKSQKSTIKTPWLLLDLFYPLVHVLNNLANLELAVETKP